ncbi:2,3,4,5-tetrahydropyridine-2,6-dicarboxylate N-succinyltransferase [Isoalcanivorax beigongshangi]|uniref:2,3,4,5-tetrahydropyridine-2,6-dicarboxylate N-succinyltransferase n=1 Tax=Isoalcanivorax beigongshangi TaxID=3238810 RepID=A0ABV4AFP4_9GAMM
MFALALGCGTQNRDGDWLELFFPAPLLEPAAALVKPVRELLGERRGNQALAVTTRQLRTLARAWREAGHEDQASYAIALQESDQPCVLVALREDLPPTSTPEAYLKLHLLSHRLARPHQLNLEGLFDLLPNVAWTSDGAIDLDELPEKQLLARLDGRMLTVFSVDKFPRMVDYVVPEGVRIADTARVRLGAYLGAGTTVMHEGFVNFNAGTEGPAMVEGRISAGVTLGRGADLGGGASTMGTLSGGGELLVHIGDNCLIGANAGTGIPLGDRCTIESGLYITAGTKVVLVDAEGLPSEQVKARDLAGQPDLLFRRNSLSGAVECLRSSQHHLLNSSLHDHN